MLAVCFLCFAIIILNVGREWLEFKELMRKHESLPLDPCEVMEKQTPMLPSSKLPKIIHQMWPKDKPMPVHVDTWFRKWDTIFPGIEHRLWSDEDIQKLIETDFPWFMPTFKAYPYNIMKVDAARPFVLYKYGGLYADMDYEPLQNFWNRLPDDIPSFVESFWAHEPIQNSLITSPPGHPFWNYTFSLMMQRASDIRVGGPMDTLQLTGPLMVEEALKRYNVAHPDHRLRTLPCQNWHRFTIGYQVQGHQAPTRTQNYYDGNVFKKCGVLLDCRCHLAIHHSRSMWLE
jgi:mannosyltransferase OCH1-like enzyme